MGIVIDGKYYPDKTAADFNHHAAPVAAQADYFNRKSQCVKYDREIIQPYTADGKPNPEFIKHYPEESKQYGFVKERQ